MQESVFLNRALQMSEARLYLQLSEPCKENYDALVLLCIHASIAFNDALHMRLTREVPKSQNHMRAASMTESALKKIKLDTSGIRHLKTLLANKSDLSYGPHTVTPKQADVTILAAERFQVWAQQTLERVTA